MMHEFLNSSWLSQTWNTMVHPNGLQNSTKMYSIATDAIVRSKPKSLRLSRTLIDDPGFVIVLLIALVCGMIQRKYHDKCKDFALLQRIHSL
jgi:hypothetical protein